MNNTKYKWVLYSITIVIIITIGIQVYWNYKNYLVNKQQLINDVQISLDNAVDTYYTDLAKKTTFGFASFDPVNPSTIHNIFNDVVIDSVDNVFINSDSINSKSINGIQIFKGIKTDSLINDFEKNYGNNDVNFKTKINNNTLLAKSIKSLSTKIVISFKNDTINLSTVDSLLTLELNRKKINVNHGISFVETYSDTLFFNKHFIKEFSLNTTSKSSFLPEDSSLNIHFTNETKAVLKRILSGILISTLLVLAVISCLFYLLKIIKHQRQLAEVRNDFISNITHEFKTPIATIGVALESIKDFNVIDNKEKTKTYLDMSSSQLSKLNVMVEKLLETATLDSQNLSLKKEPSNLFDLITLLVNKHQLQTEDKTISFHSNSEHITANIDAFHFENTINNIIDNAIKYGGNIVQVHLEQNTISCILSISDNGNTLVKTDKARIFEKFYRIPKGNTHDVKGFGIGLYYSKKIIEKHGGTIDLNLENKLTTFKISIPNA